MKYTVKVLFILFVFFFTMGSLHLYAQETRTLDGVRYTIIDPITYAFNADTKTINVGERYVIDGTVLMINGATLYLDEVTTGYNRFRLSAVTNFSYGTNVRIYVEIISKNAIGSVEAKVIRIESR